MQFDFPDDNGKPYKTSGGKMVWNDELKREIPEGWKDGKLNDIISLEYGKPLKEEDRSGTGYPVLGSNGVVGYHKDFLVRGPGIIIGRKGSAGAVVRIAENFYPIDTTYFAVDLISLNALHFHLQFLTRCNLKSLESSSAVPGLNRNTAHSIPSIIPPRELINRYNNLVDPFYLKYDLSCKENQQLSNLRDWLLPMLMNGQVKVGEAAETLSMAAEPEAGYKKGPALHTPRF